MTKRECIFICVVILRFFSACNAKELMMKEVECCPESIGGNWSQIASGSFFYAVVDK